MKMLLIIETDGDSKVYHPIAEKELKSICNGKYIFEYDFKDTDEIIGHFFANAFKLSERVYDTLIRNIERDIHIFEDEGYIENGNYHILITRKQIYKL